MFLTFSTDDVTADASPECERSGIDSRLRHRIFFKSLITTYSIHCYIWWPVGSLSLKHNDIFSAWRGEYDRDKVS